jgi:A/G-specific adenine glycosylase
MGKFDFQRIPAPLLSWYRENKRDLPWRGNPTPYEVWVSEIMLQQTRVEAVKEYYVRFMRALPNVQALAECEEEKLLKLWEGLGYYSRVRNMQKAAKQILAFYGGEFPCDVKALQGLAGIGSYTAGAIASIAFGKRTPAVDGNVFRVMSRLMKNPTPIDEPKYRPYLEEKLRAIYPEEGTACGDFTQSLMELGALVCKPTSPACEACPLQSICKSYEDGVTEEYPVKGEKLKKREERLYVFLLSTPSGICVRKRKQGVLKGTYEFPSVVIEDGLTPEKVLKEWGMSAFTVKSKRKYVHIFTHIRWEMETYFVEAETAPFECYSLQEIQEKISLPTAFRQCLSMLGGDEK